MSALLALIRTTATHNHGPASRSARKTASYALMHLIVAMAVVYALTRDWRAALAIGLVEPLVQTLAYTLHERAWAKAGREPAQREAGPAGAAGAVGPAGAHQGAAAP
ncbi:DUF2061 domain-containing protein [Maricaulaceae bacterium MS644]